MSMQYELAVDPGTTIGDTLACVGCSIEYGHALTLCYRSTVAGGCTTMQCVAHWLRDRSDLVILKVHQIL